MSISLELWYQSTWGRIIEQIFWPMKTLNCVNHFWLDSEVCCLNWIRDVHDAVLVKLDQVFPERTDNIRTSNNLNWNCWHVTHVGGATASKWRRYFHALLWWWLTFVCARCYGYDQLEVLRDSAHDLPVGTARGKPPLCLSRWPSTFFCSRKGDDQHADIAGKDIFCEWTAVGACTLSTSSC